MYNIDIIYINILSYILIISYIIYRTVYGFVWTGINRVDRGEVSRVRKEEKEVQEWLGVSYCLKQSSGVPKPLSFNMVSVYCRSMTSLL